MNKIDIIMNLLADKIITELQNNIFGDHEDMNHLIKLIEIMGEGILEIPVALDPPTNPPSIRDFDITTYALAKSLAKAIDPKNTLGGHKW